MTGIGRAWTKIDYSIVFKVRESVSKLVNAEGLWCFDYETAFGTLLGAKLTVFRPTDELCQKRAFLVHSFKQLVFYRF
jgi:hypothetical protein